MPNFPKVLFCSLNKWFFLTFPYYVYYSVLYMISYDVLIPSRLVALILQYKNLISHPKILKISQITTMNRIVYYRNDLPVTFLIFKFLFPFLKIEIMKLDITELFITIVFSILFRVANFYSRKCKIIFRRDIRLVTFFELILMQKLITRIIIIGIYRILLC